jgi:YopX protein.
MRTIKFRGQEINTGKWVYGFLTPLNHDTYCGVDSHWCINTDILKCFEIIHETVGQLTGLTDINSKVIYEGDILTSGNVNYKVEYNDGDAAFWIINECETTAYPLNKNYILDYEKWHKYLKN